MVSLFTKPFIFYMSDDIVMAAAATCLCREKLGKKALHNQDNHPVNLDTVSVFKPFFPILRTCTVQIKIKFPFRIRRTLVVLSVG